ncbi:hypothetical protein F4780DRAFT_666314 [Xylariomycetidae sp. FL0641]|nr:hypothetical protein F4780DRAFT_666314 [Xylariomycetidae sp. FL0641]
MEAGHIDALLERYLHLLHEYTSLREQLGSLQAGVYQNIARANFTAERGMRFGQDQYDDRMQASRRLAIATEDRDTPSFTVTAIEPESQSEKTDSSGPITDEGMDAKDGTDTASSCQDGEQDDRSKKAEKKKDPLRWFGLLTPMPLRQAQAKSIQAVEQIIPRLVTVNAEMAHVEIEVRRARKKRSKAEAAAAKREAPQNTAVSEAVAS